MRDTTRTLDTYRAVGGDTFSGKEHEPASFTSSLSLSPPLSPPLPHPFFPIIALSLFHSISRFLSFAL